MGSFQYLFYGIQDVIYQNRLVNMQPGEQPDPILNELLPRQHSQGQEDHFGLQTGQNIGKWNQEENAKYVAFLQCYRNKFNCRQDRRTTKFYKKMAEFILTRNSLQCRTHHQKLQAKYRYPNRIIADYKKSNNLTLYFAFKEEFYQKYPEISANKTSGQRAIVKINQAGSQTELLGTDLKFIAEQEWSIQQQQRNQLESVRDMGMNQQRWEHESRVVQAPFFYYPCVNNGFL